MALRDKLMRRDLFEDFCREYVRELNRLWMEHRASLTHGRAELAGVEREIRKLIQAIKDGASALSIKDELLSLEARKAELQARLEAPEMRELLHPRMSDVYREKVASLCLALENEESRTGAAEAIRALVEAIVLEPDGERLNITLKGDLAGMLSAARDSKRSPDVGDLMGPNKVGCGGVQPTEFGVLVGGSVALGSVKRPATDTREFLHGPPDLAVEVLTPDDRPGDGRAKVEEYLARGGALVLVVYRDERSVTAHRPLAPPVVDRATTNWRLG